MSQSIQIPVTQVGLEQSIAAAMKRVGNSSQINLGTNSKQINALSQPLGRITGQADEFSKSMAAANARVLAFGASASIIAGVSVAMSGLLSSTIKVEKSLVEINAVLGVSGDKLDKFGQGIFNVAKNTGKSFEEVATGALELARQGLSAEETLTRLNDALILSRLSGLDAAKSVEGLTAAFNSFKSSGISTAEILNNIVAVSQKFAVSEKDIIEGLGRSASVADLAGVSFNELAAIITAVQEKTARGGAVIGNSFKTIFARIQDKAVLSDLQDMGIAVTTLQGDVLPALKILENLAAQMDGFSQIEQADISKKLGGIYQLDKLLAALKDLSSESSVYRAALKEIEIAGDSAYKKNAVLNETLASLINKVTVSAEQLGAKLGEIGVTDSLKNLLGFFNSLLEGIQKVLGEESGLGTLVQGLVKGLGNLFAGPGLALFGAIILKLSKDLVQFGFASLKAFFGIGQAAKEVQNVESAISQVLARNVGLQQQLFALEGNRAGQLKLITGALVEQEALLRRSASISSGLAAPLYNVGVRASDSGLRIKNKAGGYMPAVAKESQAINSGVGGARRGDKPVVIPNFNFGQGAKGTVVAHTGEYVVPNFGGGKGSAIFNRDMVQKMGLPDGAQKITASEGLIPNFAQTALSVKKLGIGGLQGKELKYNFDKYVVGSESEKNGDQKTAPYVLAGRIFESRLQGLKYIDIQENKKQPDIQIGSFRVSEAKLSGKAAYDDPSFGIPALMGGKGNRLVLPSTASTAYDEKLKKDKGATINRKTGITHSSLFGEARAIIRKYKNTPREQIGNTIKIASSGFVPNFAPKFNAETVRQYANDIERYKSPTKDFYTFPDGTGGYGSQIKNVLSRAQSKATTNKQTEQKKISDAGFYDLDADALGGILLVSPKFGKSKGSLDISLPIGKIPFFNQEKAPAIDKNKYIKLNGIKTTNTPSGRDLQSLQGDISQLFAAPIVDLAYKLYGNTFDPASGGEFVSKLKSLDPSKKQQLLPAAAQGDIFEAAGKVALNSFANLESLFGSAEQSRPFDFQDADAMQKMFGVNTKRGEAKRGGEKNFSSSKQVSGIIKKVFNDPEYSLTALESLRSQGAFNFSKAQKAASAANAAKGLIPNFVNQKYITETLARIKAGTSGFSKQEQETFLSKFGARSTGGKLSIRDVYNKLDGEMGVSQLIDKAYAQAGAAASNEDVYRVFENQTKANPYQLRSAVSKLGFVPNFANPLQDAVGREMTAGVPASQIYIDKNSSLKNAMNPMGLMVANRRDEPAGGFQGINRARREGANPMTYGAAGGFVPNYAADISQFGGMKTSAALAKVESEYKDALSKITDAIKAELSIINAKKGVSRKEKAAAEARAKALSDDAIALQKSTNATKAAIQQNSKRGLLNPISPKVVDPKAPSGNRDMLGTIFAVQGALSVLTGATEGATGGLGAFTNGLSAAAGTATTALFASQGLSQAFGGAEKGVGKFLGKLGPYGAAAAFAFAGYQELTKYLDKTNPAIQKAGEAMSRVSDAASKAAINLNTLNPAAQERVKKEAKSIIDEARTYTVQTYGGTYGGPYGGGAYSQARKFEYEGVSSELKDGFENLVAQARGVGVSEDEIDKLIKPRFESEGKMTAKEVEEISNQLSSQISNIAKEGSPQSIIRNLTKEQRQEFAAMSPEDLEKNIAKRGKEGDPLKVLQDAFYKAGISGDIARQESIRKTIELLRDQANAEAEAQKEAVAQAPIALRQTIKAIQREKLERESIRAIDQEAAKARYNSSLLIAGIETDLTLSASERTIKTIEAQAALEKQTAELEAQKTIQEEINKLVAEFSENPAFKQIPGGEKTARSTLNRLTKDPKAQALMSETNVDVQEAKALQIAGNALAGSPLMGVEGAAQALADELLKALNLQNNSNQSLADANKEREKGKELEIAKNKIQEQNNRLLQEAQGRISAIADNYTMNAAKVAGQLRLNSPRQELALAQYNATTQETDPRKLREDQRRIIDEFFQKQVNLQAEQSRIEAEADFIRNLKVEENITRLNDNTKATDENTKALKEFLTVDDSLNNSNEKREISPGYDSQHLRKLIAAEVGGQGQDAQAAFLATIMNRANARGEPIDTIAKNSAYYQPLKPQNLGKFMETPPISEEQLNALLRNPNINLPYQHNVTGGGNVDGQRLLQNAGVNYSEAIKSGRAKEIAGEIYYLKPGESSGIRSTGITSRQVSDNTIGIGKGAIDQAKNLSSIQDATKINEEALEYARTVTSTEESARGLAEQIKTLAIRMQQIGTDKALSGEENRLKNMAQSAQDTVRSLAYLDKVNIEQSMEQAPSTFAEGMKNGFLQMQADGQNFSYLLGKDIPKMFSDGMSGAINSAIEGTVSLKDGLRSAAYEFVKTINQRMMSNLVDKIVGGAGQMGGGGGGLAQGIGGFFSSMFASGGMVNGGSGSKDDVPAMLMGGEYVVNKKAVAKYGAQFLESVNNGTLTGYAKGGSVQRGPQGNFYTPGTFGQGAIEGKRNLLDFATQTGTTGQFDKIVNQSGYQAIDLEPESSRLSVSGMRNSPQFEATQAAKEQAFDLYLQQYNAELEAKKAEKEQKKAFRKQLMMLAISTIAAPVLGAAGAGFGAAFKAAGASGQGLMSQLGAGFKGIFTGGTIGNQQVGGLGNLFSSVGKAFTGDFAGAGNQFNLSQIGNAKQLSDLYQSDQGFASYIDQKGGIGALKAERVSGFGRGAFQFGNVNKFAGGLGADYGGGVFDKYGNYNEERAAAWEKERGYATGGMIPSTSGIDTVPAMLSGGEFVMNRSAVQGIGSQNLQSMNSGGTSITSEETSKKLNEQLLAKLDELISASGSTGDITINVAPSGQSSQENSQDPSAGRQQLARQIKDAVLQIINDEKRIGGSLRR
jgi:TP901 family phage tail tape measure protein